MLEFNQNKVKIVDANKFTFNLKYKSDWKLSKPISNHFKVLTMRDKDKIKI